MTTEVPVFSDEHLALVTALLAHPKRVRKRLKKIVAAQEKYRKTVQANQAALARQTAEYDDKEKLK